MSIVYNTAVQLSLFPTKVCKTCNPPTEKFLYEFQTDNSKKDKHRAQCKECESAKKKLYYTDNRESLLDKSRTHRINNSEYYREYLKAYRPKKNSRQRERYNNDPEYRKNYDEKRRPYHPSPEARKRAAIKSQQWAQEHPEKITQYAMRRQALKKSVTVGEVDYERILARDGYFCHICEQDVTPDQLSFDHVIPLSRGGAHSEDNIKVAHRVCNSRKNARLMEELTPYDRRGPDC